MHQRLVDLSDEQVDDQQQILVRQRIEQDYLVQPVQKLRIEHTLDLAHHHIVLALGLRGFVRRLETKSGLFLQLPRAQIRSQDDDRVAEVNRVAQPIGQLAVLENLQKN